jgi:hypothetical protein
VRLQAQAIERFEVQIRTRFRPLGVTVCGHDRVEAFEVAEAAEMTRDPLVVAAAHHRGQQAEPLCFGEVLLHARPEFLELRELVLACTATRVQRLLVEPPSDELLQMAEWIEGRADRADERDPLVLRQLVPVLAVELLPNEPGGSLGVDEQAVEVEEEPADCHTVSLPEWLCSASTWAGPSRMRSSWTTAA